MELSVEVAGLKLKTPLVLASGVMGTSLAFFKEIDRYVGAVTTKSLGPEPRAGNTPPVVVELPYGMINAMGLPNPGIDRFAPTISEAKKVLTSKVVVSVFGRTPGEYAEVASKAEEAGADAVELNLSCPHERLVAQFSHDPKLASQVVSAVSST
ncbi:TPA: dihydroorotate dehydrogenase, partial [Candidatus Micrarchaeota archaeon]|nr:dihydroorotate dehydrogenase [Candidatus Micrarchaeota archaeon]